MPLVATEPFLVAREHRACALRVLRVLARVRFVTRGSLIAWAGPLGLPPDAIDAWIAAGLVHQGRVRLDPLVSDETAYLALAPAGARAIAVASGAHVEPVSSSRMKRTPQKRAHDVFVGETALAVIAAEDDGLIDLAGVETDDKKLSLRVLLDEPGSTPEVVTLRPDALVVARDGDHRSALLIEVDRGTISAKSMQRRYAAYLAWQRDGGAARDFATKALRVLTLAPSEARMKALHGAALAARSGRPCGFLLFALQDDVTPILPERMVQPVALQLGSDGHRVSILPRRGGAEPEGEAPP